MTLDRPLREALVRELADALAGARVRRVHQPEPATLVIQFHPKAFGPRRIAHRLLVCSDPEEARVHLTTRSLPNPATPPSFCMLARKHLEGRVVDTVRARPGLPVIEIAFAPPLRGGTPIALSVELTGHAGTALLVDEAKGLILGALRQLPAAKRDLSAGARYAQPALPGRLDPESATPGELLEVLERLARARRPPPMSRLLSRAFDGVSRSLATEALEKVQSASSPPPDAAGAARILAALRALLATPADPWIALDASGEPAALLPFPLESDLRRGRRTPSVSEALDLVSAVRGAAWRVEKRRGEALRAIDRLADHRLEKIEKQRADLESARGGDRHRLLGDLLLSQGDAGRRGLSAIEVVDLYDPDRATLTVPLDPRLTIAANAARLYQRARKLARATTHLSTLIARGESEIRFLSEQRLHAEQAADVETLGEIGEIVRAAFTRTPAARKPEVPRKARADKSLSKAPRGARRAPGVAPETGPRKFSVEGWEILAGRHSRDNDRIVSRLGAPHDLWLHAQGVPGAHVLIRNPARGEPPGSVVEAAARIAAQLSAAGGEANVDVTVAPLHRVKKRKGLLPGQVEVTGGKTVRVRPGLPEAKRGGGERV